MTTTPKHKSENNDGCGCLLFLAVIVLFTVYEIIPSCVQIISQHWYEGKAAVQANTNS